MIERIKRLFSKENFWPIFSGFIWFFSFVILWFIIILSNKTHVNKTPQPNESITQTSIEQHNNKEDQEEVNECEPNAQVWQKCGWWTVFYVWNNLWSWNQNILVAPDFDESERKFWALDMGNLTWANDYNYWYNNTRFLAQKWSQAATACWEKESYGFNDWYLPARNELYQIWLTSWHWGNDIIWNFTDYRYWSSTQADKENAYSMYFSYANINRFNKRARAHIRCIRQAN